MNIHIKAFSQFMINSRQRTKVSLQPQKQEKEKEKMVKNPLLRASS